MNTYSLFDKNQTESPHRFIGRHLGSNQAEQAAMLDLLDVETTEELMAQVIPATIRIKELNLPQAQTEPEFLQWVKKIGQMNQNYRSFLGQGFYPTYTPSVIARGILENPGWYTQYTPYQPEISQGRLEALLNFQTMVCEITKMDIANASLLDEATAAAEAMQMVYRLANKQTPGKKQFLVGSCFPTTYDVLKTRAEPLGIELLPYDEDQEIDGSKVFGGFIQNPNDLGQFVSVQSFCDRLHAVSAYACVATDLFFCTLFEPPGTAGADVVVGNSQRFGVPVGYGGPHAAFFATKRDYVREMPGRIIGITKDCYGQTALRMALQTREQHIKRAKATSNICTAQALLAIIAGFYALYHGPKGLWFIAKKIYSLAHHFADLLQKSHFQVMSDNFFDTVVIQFTSTGEQEKLLKRALELKVNLRSLPNNRIAISFDEQTQQAEWDLLCQIFSLPESLLPHTDVAIKQAKAAARSTPCLEHEIFRRYSTETELQRYMRYLEMRDLSLLNAMIPLGSCTMKLNAASAMIPLSNSNFNQPHPFAPFDQCAGYQVVLNELGQALKEITGLPAVSFQPNSGAQGEYAGLLAIRKYFAMRKENRHVAFIPTSAHGTNPASASMAGMEIVPIVCNAQGEVSVCDLQQKLEKYSQSLACIMLTYPSTHGIYEEQIVTITKAVHDHGGLVYMDGANMNAQVGLTQPAKFGVDVCHLNLHKTFSIPHGGGGPGMGPILARDFLAPFLPGHRYDPLGAKEGAVSATPFGSASILLIALAYVKMLGADGLKQASQLAIINANYILARLSPFIAPLYLNQKGRVAHELIIDIRPFKTKFGIDVSDFAKRLIDYGFHPPTISFPVAGTMMIEPTESESKKELDRLCDAFIAMVKEIAHIDSGRYTRQDNPLKNAPHTHFDLIRESWPHPYSRNTAVYPNPAAKQHKFWPSANRIDDVWGDRNLHCVRLPNDSLPEKNT